MKIEPVATAHANGRIERHVVLGYAAGPERLYNEAQLRQLGEACAALVETQHSTKDEQTYGLIAGELIRNLIKEMLG
mgnify:CR=1 FL=1